MLQLRRGFTLPTMGSVDSANPIHSAAYFELWGGTQYVLYGQGTALKRMAVNGGAVTALGTLSNSNPWGHFRANNRLLLGNGTDFKSYDGTTLRNVGIRAPNSTESSAVTVTATTATAGSFSTTTLSGYDLYMAYFNPVTDEVGNRVKIGSRTAIPGSGYSLVVGGLPNLASVDGEWVKVLGRTPDGGEVPYWFTDANGNRITVGNTASTATITVNSVEFTAELPTRNTVGSDFTAFAKTLGRVFAIKANDNFLYYSEAEEDAVNGDYVGRPEASWPANNAEAFPTGEIPIGVHSYSFETWVFSRNHLAIWSEILRQQVSDPWRGVWNGAGIGGQRLFVETPRGPFWVSGDKQLMTWGGGGPVVVDEEYHALLARISDANLATAEIAYFLDPAIGIDQLKIQGRDASGNPVVVIHDFRLRDGRSPMGQGYEALYTGMVPQTFVGAGYSPRAPVRDTSKKERCWTGDTVGRFAQLDDGTDDGGADYTGDYVTGPIHLGEHEPTVSELQWFGDEKVVVNYTFELDDDLNQFDLARSEVISAKELRNAAKFGGNRKPTGKHLVLRLQLTSHGADGNFDVTDPPNCPVSPYGRIYGAKIRLGADRPEGR